MARFVPSPETFVVEEIAAYEPCGEGSHTYLWIEKRDLTTPEAARRLARSLDVEPRDVGWAGMKDRRATTRQWLSVPDVHPDTAMNAAIEGLNVLEARRHGNKLKTGHLRGNRFEVVLTDVANHERAPLGDGFSAIVREGLANTYGRQRFGSTGDNVRVGLAILRGEHRERDHRRRKLLLSAVQSEVFNQALALREAEGGLRRVLHGDVLQKVGSGGLFISEDPAVDQARVDAGELIPTGPMPGSREMEPPEGTPARALEDRAVAAAGVTRAELASVGRDLPGSRRPLLIPVAALEPATDESVPGLLRLRFSLPAGGYATVLLEALARRLSDDEGVLGFAEPAVS